MAEDLRSERECREVRRPERCPLAFDVVGVGLWEGTEGTDVPCLGANHRHGGAAAVAGASLDHDDRVEQGPALRAPPPT